MFCIVCWTSLYGMNEENLKTPPSSPRIYNSKRIRKSSSRLKFINDTQIPLKITTFAAQHIISFNLAPQEKYCLETGTNKAYFLSITEPAGVEEYYPQLLNMHSSLVGGNSNLKETICVNNDGIFLYYEFLQNPVKIMVDVSLQRIWAHAEQA